MSGGAAAFPWTLASDVVIRPLAAADAGEVLALITANRAHLDQWLRWSAAIRTRDDVTALITRFEAKLAARDGFHCGVRVQGALAGGLVCHYINRDSRNAEIGYWLGREWTGRGLATRGSRRALDHLFGDEGLHRVEMQCGTGNARSRAVPERLGFALEGIRRESHWITDRFVDHAVYSMLARDWNPGEAL